MKLPSAERYAREIKTLPILQATVLARKLIEAVLEAAAEVPYEWARKLGDKPRAGCVEEQIAKDILKLKDEL